MAVCSRLVLNQSMYSAVASSTAARVFHSSCFLISSVLYRPIADSTSAFPTVPIEASIPASIRWAVKANVVCCDPASRWCAGPARLAARPGGAATAPSAGVQHEFGALAGVRAENLVRSCDQQSCSPSRPAGHVPAVRLPPAHADDLVTAVVPGVRKRGTAETSILRHQFAVLQRRQLGRPNLRSGRTGHCSRPCSA